MVVVKHFVLNVDSCQVYDKHEFASSRPPFLTPTATEFLAGKVTTDVLPLARSFALSGRTRQNTRIQHVSPDISAISRRLLALPQPPPKARGQYEPRLVEPKLNYLRNDSASLAILLIFMLSLEKKNRLHLLYNIL